MSNQNQNLESSEEQTGRYGLDQMYPSPTNPRKTFDPKETKQLADNILQVGQIHPIILRRKSKGEIPFEIVAGERRWRAMKLIGAKNILAIVKELNDAETLNLQISENLARKKFL